MVNTRKFTYTGDKTREISFPLGGIGTGCIGLGGDGRLIDWEIFNKPNKGSFNGFSHFAVRVERGDKVIDARILNSDFLGSYMGDHHSGAHNHFGFGPSRNTLAGLPHFHSSKFIGTFPVAKIDFVDKSFPGHVSLTAFNPFIPLNDRDSGIPAAFFKIEVKNTTLETLTYGVAGTLANPLPEPQSHAIDISDDGCALHLRSSGSKSTETVYGDLTLATDASAAQGQAYWYRGGWMDNLETYWRDFTTAGAMPERSYPADKTGGGNHGTLLAPLRLAPGQSGIIRFVITWNFPNCENYWSQKKDCDCTSGSCGEKKTWKNYYATLWQDSAASAAYALAEWERLERETRLFRDALFSPDLPAPVLDAVSANISILKSPTSLRLEDGTFYGWEGCCTGGGCCEGSCTHVWNYAQALPFLFPRLERGMRDADYRYNLREDGGMPFRLQLPLGAPKSAFRPCADGQLGGVMKVYRDWKISGDTEWLRQIWPSVKSSLEFTWNPKNVDLWDPERTGVLHGRQHHTLDMELFGPNSWLTGFYLGALKAASQMATALEETASAAEYGRIFEKGRKWVEKNLYNGEYYYQSIKLADRGLLEKFSAGGERLGGDYGNRSYWHSEQNELKYQIGEGCATDQVLAQWHADLCGLGTLFDKERTRSAMTAVFRHNFKASMRHEANIWRLYSLNDEGGLIICSWPEGRRRPAIPLTYAPETMTGFEYAAACAMIQNNLLKEGLAVVKAVRNRYDGSHRNPWNEIECGSNYARAMASFALLPALSGFEFDMTRGMIGFSPKLKGKDFRCFWSVDSAWGTVHVTKAGITVKVLYGSLELQHLRSSQFAKCRKVKAMVNGKIINTIIRNGEVSFESAVTLAAGKNVIVLK